MEPIPQEWIKAYIDKILELAGKMPSDLQLLRADHIMCLVKAFRERDRT
jgi:hypothetical protein